MFSMTEKMTLLSLLVVLVSAQLAVAKEDKTWQPGPDLAGRMRTGHGFAGSEMTHIKALRLAQSTNDLPAVLEASQATIVALLSQGRVRDTAKYFDVLENAAATLYAKGALSDSCLYTLEQLCDVLDKSERWSGKGRGQLTSDDHMYLEERLVKLRIAYMKEHPHVQSNVGHLHHYYLTKKRYADSVKLLETAVAANRNPLERAKLEVYLADSLEKLGDSSRAQKMRERSRQFFKQRGRTFMYLISMAESARAMDNLERSLKYTDEAIQLLPRSSPTSDAMVAYTNAKLTSIQLKQYKRAEGYARKALALPKIPDERADYGWRKEWHKGLAETLNLQGRIKEAREEMAKYSSYNVKLRTDESEQLQQMLEGMDGALKFNKEQK